MGVGFGALANAIAQAETRGLGEPGYLPQIYWTDDRSSAQPKDYKKVVRFLTDDIWTVKFYEYLTINDGVSKRDFIVPKTVDPALKEDWIKDNVKVKNDFSGKMEAPWGREMTVGIVVLREEYIAEVNGERVFKYRDKETEVEVEETYEENGEEKTRTVKKMVKTYGIVKQGHKNFWSYLVAYFQKFGTIIDRDYTIERNGSGANDTQYLFLPGNPIEGLKTKEDLDKVYSPPMSLEEWIREQASQERVKKLLLPPEPGEAQEENTQTQADPQSQASQTASGPKAGSDFDSLRSQLLNHGEGPK